ncbi:PEP-CTERM sorting domain-containing protein [Aeoliella sp.]|uniref:PEP-CTERM sorting domain-containing protein n=1 Tax=Aeoliella sp. TaxID=2795800 RepID=UPI003CCB95A6
MRVNNLTRGLSAALAAGGLVVLAENATSATILTGLASTNDPVPTDHGSNAPGTPNVALAWDSDWDQYSGWPNDPGDGVYQHDNDIGSPHTIVLTPELGVDVTLTSLDLNVWTGGGDTDVDWSVTGSISGLLGSGTWSTPDASVVTNPIGLSGTGSESLTLSLTQTSGSASYLAVDNLAFDQTGSPIPEPATLALLGLGGFGAAAMRRKS